MTGPDIIGARLLAHAPLLGRVPVEHIKGGMLPDGIGLPAILVRTVSLIDRQTLAREDWVRSTARVSVTVRAASYVDQTDIIAMVRSCCPGAFAAIGGAMRVSILTDSLGPDLIGPGNSFEQAQDFKVSFDAPA
jgi:hypothetical protein